MSAIFSRVSSTAAPASGGGATFPEEFVLFTIPKGSLGVSSAFSFFGAGRSRDWLPSFPLPGVKAMSDRRLRGMSHSTGSGLIHTRLDVRPGG